MKPKHTSFKVDPDLNHEFRTIAKALKVSTQEAFKQAMQGWINKHRREATKVLNNGNAKLNVNR